MASKNLVAGIIAGLVIVGVVLGGVIMTIPLNNSDVVEQVEQNEQNEPVTPGDEPVEQEEPEEQKDPVWWVTSGGSDEPEEEPEEEKPMPKLMKMVRSGITPSPVQEQPAQQTPVVSPIPDMIFKGTDLVISGTAADHKNETVTVELLSTSPAALCQPTVGSASFVSKSATIGEDGSWTITIDTTTLNVDTYYIFAFIGQLGLEYKYIKVVEEPTINTIPEQITKGNDFIISGTAVGFKGETVKVEFLSKTHIFGVTKTATVAVNGSWEVDASDIAADEYTVTATIGDIAIGSQDVKIVIEQPTINQTPETVTIGQDFTISGTAVSYKGKMMHVILASDGHSYLYDAHKVAKVDKNGSWSVTFDTAKLAEDLYYIYPYIGIDEIDLGFVEVSSEENCVISGTAVGHEGEWINVGIIPDARSGMYEGGMMKRVDETGSWSATINTSNMFDGLYYAYANFGELYIDGAEDCEFTFVTEMETPTFTAPEKIDRGYDLVVSGTAVSYKGQTVKVDVVSDTKPITEAHEVTTVDENGMWSVTIDTSDLKKANHIVSVSVGQLALESKSTRIALETPTCDQFPEHITIGQEVVISGTAVSHKGKLVDIALESESHSGDYDVYKDTTVDENGFWTITFDSADTSIFAEDNYHLIVYIGKYDVVVDGDVIIVVEAPVQQEPETTKQISEESVVTESLEELL